MEIHPVDGKAQVVGQQHVTSCFGSSIRTPKQGNERLGRRDIASAW